MSNKPTVMKPPGEKSFFLGGTVFPLLKSVSHLTRSAIDKIHTISVKYSWR